MGRGVCGEGHAGKVPRTGEGSIKGSIRKRIASKKVSARKETHIGKRQVLQPRWAEPSGLEQML